MEGDNVCVPLLLDAYCMTKKSFDGPSKIAPITQPNYTSLRLDSNYIQHDLLSPIDFHRVSPAALNSRVANISKPVGDPNNPSNLRPERFGVYLHWSLPQLYRAAAISAQGTKPSDSNKNPNSNLGFRLVPNRWLLIRNLKQHNPVDADVPKLKAWIIESDRLRGIDDADITDSVDLETDVSPFVNYVAGDESQPEALQRQTEVFIGKKTDLSAQSWSEPGSGPTKNVPLTVFNTSNPMFPDYVVHNSNVFSTIDDFSYTPKKPGDSSRLTSATCDYFILGWHSSEGDGPLFDGPLAATGNLAARLESLRCMYSGLDEAMLSDTSNRRVLIHGAVYDVVYDFDGVKADTPADKTASNFDNVAKKTGNPTAGTGEGIVKMEPLSIGITPLDAILTFIKAHKSDAEQILDGEDGTPSGNKDLADEILSLSELMYSADESYSGRVRAQDLLLNANYTAVNGEDKWLFDGKAQNGGASVSPSSQRIAGKSQIDYLSDLNECQRLVDCANKKLTAMQWLLFAEWFKYVSDPTITDNTLSKDPTKFDPYVKNVCKYVAVIRSLKTLIGDATSGLTKSIRDIVPAIEAGKPPLVPTRKAAGNPFYSKKEPSICIAGIDSGYPSYYRDAIPVRIDLKDKSQIPDQKTSLQLDDRSASALPAKLLSTAQKLFKEAFRDGGRGTDSSPGFNFWTKQPFRPLFIEWTAQYYHVPIDSYGISLLSSPLGNNHTQVRYTIDAPIQPTVVADSRLITGRCLIHPQPGFALKTALASLFDNTPPKMLPEEFQYTEAGKQNRATLLTEVDQFKFISAQMSGLGSHMVTRMQGAHVKPNVRTLDGKDIIPLVAAVNAVKTLNDKMDHDKIDPTLRLDQAALALIDASSDTTPYGNLIDFSTAAYNPFKPVTHGQMIITQLNIIDKFGQSVCVPNPRPRRRVPEPPRPLHPCLADTLCPNQIKVGEDEVFNTVMDLKEKDENGRPLNPFIQLTPTINQEARINSEFMIRDVDDAGAFKGWRVANDWENPVFGWVIINYADSGLQFFLPDGTFYVELRFGGPLKTVEGLKWLPFDPPNHPTILSSSGATSEVPVNVQLVELVAKLVDRDADQGVSYFANFWATIESAIKTLPYPPSDYSQFANAIVGKPLALINTGWSLELGSPPLIAQHTLHSESENIGGEPPDLLTSGTYKFPLKLGDDDRPFDGMVAYWDNVGGDDAQSDANTFWDKVYRYEDKDPNAKVIDRPDERYVYIEPQAYPKLTPYYIHPDKTPYARHQNPSDAYSTFTTAHTAQLRVKTMLIDPYVSIHGFSPILPITELRLQPWTVQAAFRKMTAFFLTGPLLLVKNPQPVYDKTAPLNGDSWLQNQQTASDAPTPGGQNKSVSLPIKGRKGLWRWLQPYSNAVDELGNPALRYNALQVEEADGRFRADQGPYTMVEGFLQLARPLIKEDAPDV